MILSRRALLVGGASVVLAGCTTARTPAPPVARSFDPRAVAMYAALPDERFPVPAVDLRLLDPAFYRQEVDYVSAEPAGTVIVDTPNRYLYLTMAGGRAMRYGVGIGREGFAWGGEARIAWKRAWPTWTPPSEMIERQPELEEFRGGMEPGLDNPLGARALYIHEGGRDTLYRLHGTQDPSSIGRAVSSGCVRLINQDVIDLYDRVPPGTRIVVLQNEMKLAAA